MDSDLFEQFEAFVADELFYAGWPLGWGWALAARGVGGRGKDTVLGIVASVSSELSSREHCFVTGFPKTLAPRASPGRVTFTPILVSRETNCLCTDSLFFCFFCFYRAEILRTGASTRDRRKTGSSISKFTNRVEFTSNHSASPFRCSLFSGTFVSSEFFYSSRQRR